MDIVIQLLAFIGLLFVGVILAILFLCVSCKIKSKRLERKRKNQPCPYGERMNFWLTEIDKLKNRKDYERDI